MKETLPVIPRPASQRWRDIRLRHVPLLVYLVGVVTVVYLWNTHWMPGTFMGEVQSTTATVASPIDGKFAALIVSQFDRVTNGQVLAEVMLDPELANTRFATIRADLLVLQARMTVDGQRVTRAANEAGPLG